MHANHEIVETAAGALYQGVIDMKKVRAAHKPFSTEKHVHDADGNSAAAYACIQQWRMPLLAGFPITPSTKWLETVADLVGSGKYGTKRIKLMEAEHAVADYMAGCAASCRDLIFATATSSVGLDHMTESTRSLGGSGLGNLMLINVYRATANYPLCIEGDPSDALAHRDDGWIQISCRGVQQIYDTILQAPCLSMHPEIMTPSMPGYFGIKDSHKSSRLVIEADTDIHAFQDRWIFPSKLPGLINGDTALGNCVTSQYFQGFKVEQRTRMERVFSVLPDIGADFQKTFGRPGLELIEKAYWPAGGKVDVAVVGMGPDMGTAVSLAARLEKKLNIKIGVLAVRLLTPFPSAEYAKLLSGVKSVLVVNHAHHQGVGHLTLDISQACYHLNQRPRIVSCFAGMGGAVLSDDTWEKMISRAQEAIDGKTDNHGAAVVHEGVLVWQS